MARDFDFQLVYKPPFYFISYNSNDIVRVSAVCCEMNRRGISQCGMTVDYFQEKKLEEKNWKRRLQF